MFIGFLISYGRLSRRQEKINGEDLIEVSSMFKNERIRRDSIHASGVNTPWRSLLGGCTYTIETESTLSHERFQMISLVITLIVIGVLLWLVNNYIPMDGKIKQILNAIVVICVVVWLLSAFGILGHTGDIQVPQVK
ncbi:MAG: hypothetical protein LV481_06460 [Methylacidiphilales bacterium]|nr:hypothetical protein [Candidatus Methylacidiphilales bacterium]